jgi:hypothetical protein
MPVETKQNPYKPAQPAIPGVPKDADEKKKTPPPSPRPAPVAAAPQQNSSSDPKKQQMIAIGACLGAVVLLGLFFVVSKMRQPANSASTATAPVTTADAELAGPAKLAANLPIGPGKIATTEELADAWASKKFLYRDEVLGKTVPAMVVRLPSGGYWGFSLIEPFGTCRMEYVTDMAQLQSKYGFSSDHPMVADPCNHAVFDLLQWGGSSTAEVRGALVHGMGVRPPLAIEIQQHGKDISAARME